ncbi:hypothetical protein EVAR_25276_1 [Eumeta japonica]|uniref:Uncharacterized protein n=1 Tax=Eumeta variegata TaxID=151549 RepID=A0A4C1VRH4_EUMVA|nr:hypothetical protein EVAR_25276_1 [Eumeta japonica]
MVVSTRKGLKARKMCAGGAASAGRHKDSAARTLCVFDVTIYSHLKKNQQYAETKDFHAVRFFHIPIASLPPISLFMEARRGIQEGGVWRWTEKWVTITGIKIFQISLPYELAVLNSTGIKARRAGAGAGGVGAGGPKSRHSGAGSGAGPMCGNDGGGAREIYISKRFPYNGRSNVPPEE